MEKIKKMKKLLLLIVFSAALLLPRPAVRAADYRDVGECGGNLTYVLSNNGVLTITGEGDMTNFSDASLVPWFKYRTLITSVVFSGDVTSVGSYAFNYCAQLSQITLPDSVKGIGAYSFYGCSSLTEFKVPPQATGIGAFAFGGCSSLSKISLPDGLISIGVSAFSGCRNLGNIEIPESVTSIGKGAFENSGVDDSEIAYKRGSCGENLKWELLGGRKLRIYGSGAMADYTSGAAPWYANASDITELEIADGVTQIGDFAFKDCTVIRSASVADSVKRIGKSAFEGCAGLSGFLFGASVTEIGERAFFQSGLAETVFSGSKTISVGDYAFSECAELKSVNLESGSFEIGNYLFAGCKKLTEVSVSADVNRMGSHMFSGCTSLVSVSIGEGCAVLGANLFDGCTALTGTVFPEGITELPDYMFQGCTKMTQAVLPDSVTKVGTGAFSGCSSLEEVTFSQNIETVGTLAFKNCTGLKEILIPESVKSIESGAFSGCSSLERMTLPFVGSSRQNEAASAETLFGYIFGAAAYEGGTVATQYFAEKGFCGYILPDTLAEVVVTGGTLYNGAFDHCSKIRKITIAEGITGMNGSVFRDCAELTEVLLPEGITSIGANTFRGCAKLEAISIPDSVTEIGANAFSDCPLLCHVTLPEGLLSIGKGAFLGCTGLEDISFPEQITGIESEAFLGCTKLTAIDLPEYIVTIGKEAFSGCTGLTRVTFPETMTEIGNGAFLGCTGITAVTLPGGIANVNEDLFSGCTALADVTFAGSVETIGKNAFSGCVLLEEMELPETVTEIGDRAFAECTALSGIVLPGKVTKIGSGAFFGCVKFEEITVPDSVVSIGSGAFGGCSGLLRMRLPFVGGEANAQAASASTLFGYIFGTAAYTGGTAVRQYCFAGTVSAYYIPDSLVSVEITGGKIFYGAFYGCQKLEQISLASAGQITEIAECAFFNCAGVRKFTIPEGVTAIGAKAFSGCKGFSEIALPVGVESIGASAFNECTGLEKVSLADGLLEIGSNAFANCSSLKEMAVPHSVATIGAAAFTGCGALENMTLPFIGFKKELSTASTQTLFGYIFGTASYSGGAATKQYYSNSSTTYYIPAALKKVTVTGGQVRYGAFYNCGNLEQIILPEEATEIGSYAFRSCQSLEEMALPSSVVSIGSYAFMDCTNLSVLTVPKEAESIGTYAFRGCAKLADFSVPDKLTAIEPYTFSGCTSLGNVVIPDTVTVLGTYAFQNCSSMTNVNVPDSVKEINMGAFSGCSGLERISLPFAGFAGNLTQASARTLFGFIFGGIKYDGGTAVKQFYSASSSTYYIPDSLKYVEIRNGKLYYGTFYGCSRLISIVLPADLEMIGSFAFCNCTALEEVTFSGTAPSSIAQNAFTGVEASVFYPVTDATWADYVGSQFGGKLFWEEHEHKYEQTVTEPTCTERGYTTYKCIYCGKSYVIDYTDALGHTIVTDEAVGATCTASGRTQGSHCEVCLAVIEAQKVIPATGHSFTDYVSNQDATYEADGTLTAECDNGCGAQNTRQDVGSRLVDQNSPAIEIFLGTDRWTDIVSQPNFARCYKTAQTVTVTARDYEKQIDGSTIDRLDKVYYLISDTALRETQLKTASWIEYKSALRLEPDGKYIVYVKAQDRSGNISYASTDGILIDRTPPILEGIADGASYCIKAEFTVTDISLQSVTDNGNAITLSNGRYRIAGDGMRHNIVATDACQNTTAVVITAETGHTWLAPVFAWGTDNRSCTATYICKNDSSHTQRRGCTVKKETKEASCVAWGQDIYTATVVLDGVSQTDTKTVAKEALGHDYAVTFWWSDDKASCTAAFSCRRQGCSEDTPGHTTGRQECTVEAKVTESTCSVKGTKEMIASVLLDGVEYKETGSIEQLPLDAEKHVNTIIVNAKEATETAEGYTGDTYCKDCKKTVAYGTVIPVIQEPDKPVDPDNPDKPVDPDNPDKPVDPDNPDKPIDPDNPDKPVDPDNPDKPVDPENPDKPVDPDNPDKPIDPDNPDKPVDPDNPDKPVDPDNPDKPVDPDNPDKPVNPDNPDKPIDPGKPVNPDLTEDPNKPGNTVNSGGEGNSGSNTTPNIQIVLPKKGSKIKDSKGTVYTVTKVGTAVTYTAPPNKKIKSVKIPAAVKIGGVSYQVTAIAKSALKGCRSLNSVTIGKNIKTIGAKAFYKCSALKKITIKSGRLTAKSVGAKAFSGIYKRAELKVPAGKLTAYRKLLKKKGITQKTQVIKK